jgi:hypothetical protein
MATRIAANPNATRPTRTSKAPLTLNTKKSNIPQSVEIIEISDDEEEPLRRRAPVRPPLGNSSATEKEKEKETAELRKRIQELERVSDAFRTSEDCPFIPTTGESSTLQGAISSPHPQRHVSHLFNAGVCEGEGTSA